VRELRQVDQEPLRVPPHKKPRKYRLTVTYTRTTTEVCTKEFTSKASMQDFRARVEREIAKEKAKPPNKWIRWWGSWGFSGLKMDAEKSDSFTSGPTVTEELIDE